MGAVCGLEVRVKQTFPLIQTSCIEKCFKQTFQLIQTSCLFLVDCLAGSCLISSEVFQNDSPS